MLLISILSLLIGLSIGSFLTFQLLISYDEIESIEDYDYNDIESALPSNETRNDNAIVKERNNLVGDTDEIRAILAKRRRGGGRE